MIDLETKLEAFEARIDELRASYMVDGAVPEIVEAKRDAESWREFRSRAGISAGFRQIKKWVREGRMPSWMVEHVRSELGDGDSIPPPPTPFEICPVRLSQRRQTIIRKHKKAAGDVS